MALRCLERKYTNLAIRAQKCPHCGKPTIVEAEKRIDSIHLSIYTLKCGHQITEKLEQLPQGRDACWNKAWGYQKKGIEFIENSNFNCLVADEMGLGKTVQALMALRYNWESLTPVVITAKSSLSYNWMREYFKWVCDVWTPDDKIPSDKMCWLYNDGTLPLIPGFKVYIIPMSLLTRDEVQKTLREVIKPKLIIGDEVHNFKNTGSKRTQALYDVLEGIERDPKSKKIIKSHWRIPHRIMLSGTPVVNRLFEYFPVLNIIKPSHFSDIKSFAARWVDRDWETKKWLGLKPQAKNAFFAQTSGYVIRRTREELVDLPKRMPDAKVFTDDFQKEYAKEYNNTLDKLEELIEDEHLRAQNSTVIIGLMSRLRHLAGLLKIKAAVEWVTELLDNTDEKLLIGIHHKDVAGLLSAALHQYNPITISGEDSALEKDKKVQASKLVQNRLVIGNVIACGEGINGLQESINNVLILERGWNPSTEDQLIGRLDRPGQKLSVFATYLVAAGTLDDFFDELVTFKRNVVNDSTDSELRLDPEMMRELAKRVIATRLKVVGA